MVNKKGYVAVGTGATLIGAIWPIIIALLSAILAFLVKYFWKPIKKPFLKLKRKEKEINNK